MTAYANVEGHACIVARLHVPAMGAWWADVTFEEAPALSGAVVLEIGDLTLRGTIAPTDDGTFASQRRSRIVAGADGWGTLVPPNHYHSDAGINAIVIAQGVAQLAGEQLGTFDPSHPTVGFAYVRRATSASRILEDVIGTAAWWVDYDGVTHVGQRTEAAAAASDYAVLDYDPREELVRLSVDDLSAVGIGSILSEQLDDPKTVHELRINITAEDQEVVAWCGGSLSGRGRLVDLFSRAARRSAETRLPYKYRYRVVRMSVDRVELQVVAQEEGLPDVLPVSMRPGVAGAHAELTEGSIVVIEFIEGRPDKPVVTAFAGKDEGGHAPAELTLSVTATLKLGGDTASEGVALGDSLKTHVDQHQHAYTPSGTGTPALTSPPTKNTAGVPLDPAPSGSSRVKVTA